MNTRGARPGWGKCGRNSMPAQPVAMDLIRASRVLVTGAGGFLGGHLLRALNAGGIKPFAALMPGEKTPEDADAVWLRTDLADSRAAEELVHASNPHVVVHLAARLGSARSWSFASEAIETNLMATHRLMQALGVLAPELRRLVLIGSGEEYGNAASLPATEDTPTDPVSPYSASKAAAAGLALLYHKLFKLPVTILRPFIVYGPGQSGTMMLPQLIASALRGEDFPMTPGEQTRDYLYVEDAVKGILAAMTAECVDGQIFNICTGIERSVRSVAELVMDMMKPDMRILFGALPYRDNEVRRLFGSPEKARQQLGWFPETELESGLQRTIEWYGKSASGRTEPSGPASRPSDAGLSLRHDQVS